MIEKQQEELDKIEPGMVVEADQGDLGETDLSKPKVESVIKDESGNIEKIVVKKGVIFSKEIEIPVDRINMVHPDHTQNPSPGSIGISAKETEIESLKATGLETLHEESQPEDHPDFLEMIQEELPTAEGMRRMERGNVTSNPIPAPSSSSSAAAVGQSENAPRAKFNFFKILGPGFLSGMAGNDSSAVTSYSVNGARVGYSQLWLILLSTPMYQATQYACAKVGRITQQGLAEILNQHYGKKVAAPASLLLIIANVALIAADLVAVGSGLELVTGIGWAWFVVPIAVLLWYFTVFQNFEVIKKVFLLMSLAFVSYLITAVLSGPDWGAVLSNTFIPHLDFSFNSISSAVALLGATISPYTLFWQVQGEKEEKREGNTRQQLRTAAYDIASGTVSGNLAAYAIMLTTAATIFTHHGQINSAADAASSLVPVLGPAGKYLFALGLIGSGLVAIPVLLASTSYAVSGTFGLPSSLSKKPWQNEGFYLILTVSLVAGLTVALLGFDPINLMFWANVLAGILAPIMVFFILMVGNSRKIMGNRRFSLLTNFFLALTITVMVAASALLFYGLATGQGNS